VAGLALMRTVEAGSPRYSLHGYVVESPLVLDAPTTADQPNYVVELGEPREFDGAPPGRCIAELHQPGVSYWCSEHPKDPTRWTLRYPGLGEFEIDRRAMTIAAYPAPDASPELLAILVGGAVLAHLVPGSGDPILHASAVEMGGAAVAVVGPSGAGKSTVAAMLCQAGAALVTDDTLRVRLGDDRTDCFRGTGRVRLRPATEELAAIEGAEVARTADGRLGVIPRLTSSSRLPLASFVLPVPSRDAPQLEVEHLGSRDAVLALLRAPRVAGWRHPDPLRLHFEACSEMVEAIPVYRARIPWGPPFDPDMGAALLRSVGVARGIGGAK
jgi:hypothetical protein